jgi:cytochrome c oxidase subunit IV
MNEPTAHTKGRPNYTLVLILLVVFTLIEVGISYIQSPLKIPVLLLVAAVKAGLVILYFMHLRYDARIYILPFILGLALIFPLIVLMIAVMPGL